MMNVDHLLKIVQQPYVELLSRFGGNEIPEIGNLELSFRYACIAEVQHLQNIRLNLDTIRRCTVLSINEDDALSSKNILEDISVDFKNEKVVVHLKDNGGSIYESTEVALEVVCVTGSEIITGEQSIVALRRLSEIENLFSKNGKLDKWPRKREKQKQVLAFLCEIFQDDRKYTESEVNKKIGCLFDDYALIRRSLVTEGYLVRTRNGAQYWRESK